MYFVTKHFLSFSSEGVLNLEVFLLFRRNLNVLNVSFDLPTCIVNSAKVFKYNDCIIIFAEINNDGMVLGTIYIHNFYRLSHL